MEIILILIQLVESDNFSISNLKQQIYARVYRDKMLLVPGTLKLQI